jgi:(p)ppGpp synthase/HD superfamily hydrolase
MARKIELQYDYEKHCTAMRYWLLGKEWHVALKAMEMGLLHHDGERKNGNPEFSHQMFQAQYARTLPSMMFPEETLAVIFLHDIVEDHGVAVSTIHAEFGEMVGNGVDLMSDVDAQGRDKPLDAYYSMMVESPVSSLAKGIDRMHNFQSMLEVFDIPKQERYIEETREHLLTMMKAARKRYTQQEPAYQNIKHVLLTQIDLILLMHRAKAPVSTRKKA